MLQFLQRLIQSVRIFLRQKLHYRSEDLPFYLTIAIAFLIFVLAINLFVELTEELVEDGLTDFDTSVTSYVLSWRTDWLTKFMIVITTVGTRAGYFVIVGLLTAYFFLRHRSWKFIAQTVLVLILASASNVMLKDVVNRERPTIEHLVQVTTLSYPSGHAMSAMGFYGFLLFLVARYRINLLLKVSLIIVLCFMIIAIGISRIYLGVHFPSDVLAGFIGGLIWVAFCTILFDVIELYRKRKSRIGQ